MNYKTKSRVKNLLFFMVLFIAQPSTAFAVQSHGAPEGYYVHQISHILFIVAMSYIWFKMRDRQGTGWKYIRYSFILFILWNIDALLVHWMSHRILSTQFTGSSQNWSQIFTAHSFFDVIYYILRMDHLLCVPAALSFYYGLVKLTQNSNFVKRKS